VKNSFPKIKLRRQSLILLWLFLIPELGATPGLAGEKSMTTEIALVKSPPVSSSNKHYISNRPPLAPSPLVKLPIGRIRPKGWLLSQLQLMKNGFTGRLPELSRFLREDSGWITLKGPGW